MYVHSTHTVFCTAPKTHAFILYYYFHFCLPRCFRLRLNRSLSLCQFAFTFPRKATTKTTTTTTTKQKQQQQITLNKFQQY